ncbi:Hypothetical predicted protein [Cloeon dipterum]|uniref:Uncharacterized protein n=1 Tax=Cloeon dipterum TaxID=197152 RepID=A0A8S1CZS0_9INSE|nr:Hypothetical predicted protein [Cloeon dipterum]
MTPLRECGARAGRPDGHAFRRGAFIPHASNSPSACTNESVSAPLPTETQLSRSTPTPNLHSEQANQTTRFTILVAVIERSRDVSSGPLSHCQLDWLLELRR